MSSECPKPATPGWPSSLRGAQQLSRLSCSICHCQASAMFLVWLLYQISQTYINMILVIIQAPKVGGRHRVQGCFLGVRREGLSRPLFQATLPSPCFGCLGPCRSGRSSGCRVSFERFAAIAVELDESGLVGLRGLTGSCEELQA